MPDPISLAIGGASLLGGLFGGSQGSNLDFQFFRIPQAKEALKRFQELSDPNSQFFRQAGQGFFRRLSDASPSASSLNQFLSSRGIDSPTIANKQREGILARNRESASQFQSDLFGKSQNTALGFLEQFLGNERFARSAFAAQEAGDTENLRNLFSQFATIGGGILGREFGRNDLDNALNIFSGLFQSNQPRGSVSPRRPI